MGDTPTLGTLVFPEFVTVAGTSYEVVVVNDIRGDHGEPIEARVLRRTRRILINVRVEAHCLPDAFFEAVRVLAAPRKGRYAP